MLTKADLRPVTRRRLWAVRLGAVGIALFYVFLLLVARVTHPIYLLVNLLAIVTGLMSFVVVARDATPPMPRARALLLVAAWAVFAAGVGAITLLFRPEFGESLLDRLRAPPPLEAADRGW
jgi:hypothetical protein